MTSTLVSSRPIVPSRRATRTVVTCNKRAKKAYDVVLTKNVDKLGSAGDVVSVKPGFFRNFLLPRGKAAIATEGTLKSILLRRAQAEKAVSDIKIKAEKQAVALRTIGKFQIKKPKGEGKSIFGSVTASEVAEAIKMQTNLEISSKDVSLGDIREQGDFKVRVRLHPEVQADITVTVVGVTTA